MLGIFLVCLHQLLLFKAQVANAVDSPEQKRELMRRVYDVVCEFGEEPEGGA